MPGFNPPDTAAAAFQSMSQEEPPSRSGTAVVLVIAGLMLAALAYRYWPSHHRQVMRHVVNLAEALSFDGAESEAMTATRFAAVREYFAEDVRVRMDARELTTRDEVLRSIRAWTPPPGGMLVDFVDVRIALAEDAGSASVDLMAHVSARNVPRDRSLIVSRPIHAAMDRRDGDWVVRTAEVGPATTP
jgi:hypothetical protein